MKKSSYTNCISILYGFTAVLTSCNTHQALNCEGKDRELQEIVEREAEGKERLHNVGTFIATNDEYNINASCKNHMTALQTAVKSGDAKLVRLLARAYDDVDATTHGEGRTALMMAVYEGKEEIVEILLKSGANPNVSNNYGDTPISIAKIRVKEGLRPETYKNILEKLLQKSFRIAIYHKNSGVLTKLMEEYELGRLTGDGVDYELISKAKKHAENQVEKVYKTLLEELLVRAFKVIMCDRLCDDQERIKIVDILLRDCNLEILKRHDYELISIVARNAPFSPFYRKILNQLLSKALDMAMHGKEEEVIYSLLEKCYLETLTNNDCELISRAEKLAAGQHANFYRRILDAMVARALILAVKSHEEETVEFFLEKCTLNALNRNNNKIIRKAEGEAKTPQAGMLDACNNIVKMLKEKRSKLEKQQNSGQNVIKKATNTMTKTMKKSFFNTRF